MSVGRSEHFKKSSTEKKKYVYKIDRGGHNPEAGFFEHSGQS